MSTALFGILLAIAFWVAIIVVIIRIVKYLIRYGMEYGINYYFDEKERSGSCKAETTGSMTKPLALCPDVRIKLSATRISV